MLNVSLIEHTPNPERVVANSARLCYSSLGIDDLFGKFTDEQNKGMVDRLMSMRHESPLEHVSFTFGIEGISRSASHQLVRHRIGSSYSQKSQRYVSEDGFDYVVPKDIEDNEHVLEIFEETMEFIDVKYKRIADLLFTEYVNNSLKLGEELSKKEISSLKKKAMENARAVLPNACETKIIVTMNARALMNFFSLRSCRRAQEEIMTLADEMLRQVKGIAPSLFKYAGASCMFGSCTEGKMSCGIPRKPEEYEVIN